ncbi:meiosis inhibitor protein 1 isoform X4 [Myxocyprinus asiaticus]|uniref:meiosis inhibitor protein 1 isoform X4 n=1 Tax=Myxocyprinus asiaticus TaxID=70543 RepID=UPI002223EB44|nr:meiosis inhibitor protein 1 isoform X4 [Myxocyprinus asiaticus]
MSSLDVICEKIHAGHAPQWYASWERAAVCVACVAEMMDRPDVSAVRKRAALMCVTRAETVRELLYREENRRINFTCSLLRMLLCAVDSSLLDQVIEVLLQMSLDMQSQQFLQFMLDEIHSKLSDGSRVKDSLPSVMLLGKLLDAHPALRQTLTSSHLCVLECVCGGLLVSDEDLKAAVCYVLLRVWSSSAAVHTLTNTQRERMCVLLLHTLSHTHSTTVTINCLGVLKQMLQFFEVVCVLMSLQECSEEPLTYQPLPLILKKVLLSTQDSLQVVSVHCVCAILIHSPAHFSSSFIHADFPEFLFECVCSSSDVLMCSVFSCLLLLSEDPLFFSQCHSVYGIEPLVRSLKETLGKSNIEVQKRGLELLTAVLERQPAGVRLFPSGSEFSAVTDVIVEGVASSCLQVSIHAVLAATVLFRPHHQSSPVQLSDIRRIVEVVMSKCTEYHHIHNRESSCGSEFSNESVKAGAVLLQMLKCFDAACSLAEVCMCESALKDSVCSASQQQETLESLCVYLLHCCDTTCIPTVTRVCERVSSPQVLQVFFSVLSRHFSLSPAHMLSFCRKLASSGFIRLTLENRAQLCSGNRNVSLNLVCCDFLLKLCMCLFTQSDTSSSDHQAHVESVLQECLSSLCCRVCDWTSVLTDPQQSLRNTQYCIIYLLHLSLRHGDRLLCDSLVFSGVVRFMCVQDHTDISLPPSVLCSVLYLLSVTQHCGPQLDTAAVKSISRALSCCPLLFSLSSLHPSILSFIFSYPELSEHFGVTALTGNLTSGSEAGQEEDQMQSELLELLQKHPASLMSMMVVVCEAESAVAHRAAGVLRCFLCSGDSSRMSDLCDRIKSALLLLLQKLTHTDRVSVLLGVLSLVQSNASHSEMDHTDFKLLYHVSNLVGKMNSSDSELLLSALNCLYCFLCVCPSHCTDRAVSLLLGNIRLMELLEEVLSVSPSSSSSSLSALHSCSLLLLSSLINLQHTHSAQVHRSISIDLHRIVSRLTFSKRHTHSLLLMCSVKFVQVWLDVDKSSLVCVCESAALQHPLQEADGILYPFRYSGAKSLMMALRGLILQKEDLVISAAVDCLRSLIGFLHRRNTAIAQHMVCQPWNRFLLFSLLSCGGTCILHPAVLKLITLLVCFGGGISHWKTEVQSVCEEVERRGVTHLKDDSTHTLTLLLAQCCALSPPDDLRMKMDRILDSLKHLPPSDAPTQHILQRSFWWTSEEKTENTVPSPSMEHQWRESAASSSWVSTSLRNSHGPSTLKSL